MQSSPSTFDATLNTIGDIYRLINALKEHSADLQRTISLSRTSIRESQQAIKHATEIAESSPRRLSSDE